MSQSEEITVETWPMRAWSTIPRPQDAERDLAFTNLARPERRPWFGGAIIHLWPGEASSRAVARTEVYEPETMTFIGATLKPGDVFLDVGANSGLFTVAAAKWVGDTGRVIAVEPSGRERNKIKRNVSASRVRNVKVWPFALGAHEASMQLLISEDANAGLNTLAPTLAYNSAVRKRTKVRVRPLDALELPHVDLIKADIEGAETDFLLGAEQTIARNRPVIILELGRLVMAAYGSTPEDMFAVLQRYGYAVHPLTNSGLGVAVRAVEDLPDGNIVARPV